MSIGRIGKRTRFGSRAAARVAGWPAALWCAALVPLLAVPAVGQQTPPLERARPPVVEEPAPVETPRERYALVQFTTGIENREPIDQVTFVESDIRRVYFFSDLRGLAGTTVTHRWSHAGTPQAEVKFAVGGPRWRVWSSKELSQDRLGDWTVEIVTDEGETIASETFTYTAAQP